MNGAARPATSETRTRGAALASLRRALAEAGIETAALDARILAAAALGTDAAGLIAHPDLPIGAEEARRLDDFMRRRRAREPLARILGEREFWGMPFSICAATLVPRPDTETVVETALRLFPDRQEPLRIIDLGTGSGCILVALLHERPRAFGLGIDRSFEALTTARFNASRNGVLDRAVFAAGDWAKATCGQFDLLVSNPPYIPTGVIATLAPDVREHDPLRALDGGPDGLAAYRVILSEARRLLRPQGVAVLEIGYDQAEALRGLAAGAGLEFLALAHDLSAKPRCVALKRP